MKSVICLLALLAVTFAAKTKLECKSTMKTCMKEVFKGKMMEKVEKMKKVMEPCKQAGECICPFCTKKAMKKSMEEQCPDVDLEFIMMMKAMKKTAKVMKHIESGEEGNMQLIKDSYTLMGVSCHAKKMRKMSKYLCKNPQAMLECAAPIMGEKAKNAIIGIMTGKSVEADEAEDEDDGDVLDLAAEDDEEEENARRKRQAEGEDPQANFLAMLNGMKSNMMKMVTYGGKMAKMYKQFKRTPIYAQCNSELDSDCQSMMAQPPSPAEMMEKMEMIKGKMQAMCSCLDSIDGSKVIQQITDDCGAPAEAFDFDDKVEWMKKKMHCKHFQ